jgi:hypothetical protein
VHYNLAGQAVKQRGVSQFWDNRAIAFDFAVTASVSLKGTEIRIRKFGKPIFPLTKVKAIWARYPFIVSALSH